MKLIAAHTPATYPYPPYVNISTNDEGNVVITLRGVPRPGEFSSQDCGPTETITLSPTEWQEFRQNVIDKG